MVGRLPYDEAMMFSAARLKIQDTEIKQGKVETVILQTNRGPVERPWGIEGGFAVVYKFRTLSGQFRALRCFRVPMSADMQFRYEQIGPYFHAHIPTITVGLTYHEQGIMVKESGQSRGETYPIIEMDWIEGVTLIDKLHELCKKRDRTTLKALSEQWLTVLDMLRKAGIAHGDLAGQNVMVRPDGHMVLVDYDGVYIPGFANLDLVLLGQPDYQHPRASQRKFNEHMDAFSGLVIYIVLLALSVRPELWETYTHLGDKGEPLDINLLFKDQDFQAPQRSPLFKDLERLNDPRIKALVQALKQACAQPADQVRFPVHLLDPDYEKRQVFELLVEAIDAGDDEQIAACWTTLLEHYPPAQKRRSRVQLAQQRVNALARFRSALQTHKPVQIVTGYDAALLDNCKNVTASERKLLEQAHKFLQAYRERNDDAFLASSAELQRLMPGIIFTRQQQHDIALARKRKETLQRLAKALQSKDVEQIARLYQDVQLIQSHVNETEQRWIDLAFAFMQAYATNDDEKISAASTAIEQSAPGLIFSLQLQKRIKLAGERIALARRQQEALDRLRNALQTRRLRSIVSAYDPVLDNHKAITPREHAFINLARSFVQAYDNNDDDAFHTAYSSLHNAYRDLALFTQEEQERAESIEQRLQHLQVFHEALNNKQPQEIVDAYDALAPLLTKKHDIPAGQRELAQVARNFLVSCAAQDDDRLLAAYAETQKPAYRDRLAFSAEQQRRVAEAQDRAARLERFKAALAGGDAEQIVATYDRLTDIHSRLTDEQRADAESARSYLADYQRFEAAIQLHDDVEVRQIYRKICSHALFKARSEHEAYIQQMQQAQDVEDALRARNWGTAINLARRLETQSGGSLNGLLGDLDSALQKYIRRCEAEDVTAYIKAGRASNSLLVSWRWPLADLVQQAVIIYSAYNYPPRCQELADIAEAEFPCKWSLAPRRMHEAVCSVEIRDYALHQATTLYLRICLGIREFWGVGGSPEAQRPRRIYLSTGIKQLAHLSMPTTPAGGTSKY